MKPTPEIIELARKLYAAGHRQEIQKGDWYLYMDGLLLWASDSPREHIQNITIPIPDPVQALLWLMEREGEVLLQCSMESDFTLTVMDETTMGDSGYILILKAMIKILEEEADQQRKDDEWEAIRPDPQEEGDK